MKIAKSDQKMQKNCKKLQEIEKFARIPTFCEIARNRKISTFASEFANANF